jgi:hypothetical protein
VNSSSAGKLILSSATVVVIGAVVTALFVVGSPAAARRERMDQVRIENLQTIDRLVTGFARTHGRVPADVNELAHEPGYAVPRQDPESGAAYVYQRVSADDFRLCATFDTDGAAGRIAGTYAPSLDATWAHARGEQCFKRRAASAGK